MHWHWQAIFESKRHSLYLPPPNAGFEPRVSGTESPAGWMLADKPTKLSRIKLNLELNSPSYDQRGFIPLDPTTGWLSHLALVIYMLVVTFVDLNALAQASDFRIEMDTTCRSLLNAGFEPRVSGTEFSADWMPTDKPTELSWIKLKNLNSIDRHYDPRAFSPLHFTVLIVQQR